MADRESTGPESLGSYSLDDEDQLQPEDTLEDRGIDDILDEGYSPPECPRGVDAFGITLSEQRQGETLEERLARELPDPASSLDDPLDEVDMLGGDDPDAIAAEDDYVGAVGTRRSGRLVAPDEGAHEDDESDLVAEDVGIDGGASSAEEAAVNIVEDELFTETTPEASAKASAKTSAEASTEVSPESSRETNTGAGPKR